MPQVFWGILGIRVEDFTSPRQFLKSVPSPISEHAWLKGVVGHSFAEDQEDGPVD